MGKGIFIAELTARHLTISQVILIHFTPSHLISLRFHLISSYHLRLGLPHILFPSCIPTKNSLCTYHFAVRGIFSPYWPSLFNRLNNIFCLVQSRISSLYSFHQAPLTPSIIGSDIFLSTLLFNILSLCYSFSRKTKFHTHTEEVLVQYNDIGTDKDNIKISIKVIKHGDMDWTTDLR